MFTGIIQALGRIGHVRDSGGDWRLRVLAGDLDLADVALGDSIAVSGVCLTVVAHDELAFEADVSRETLDCTTLRELRTGSLVNLEKALRPQDRLGGHIVSGHVDGVAELLDRRPDGRSERLLFRVPAALARYIAHKGSVCLDGVSLTVNEVEGAEFGVNIIPHTAQRTTIHEYRPGRKVNVEVDLVSRYLERLLQGEVEDNGQGGAKLTFERLARAGFAER